MQAKNTAPEFDAVVIGGGITGIYQVYKLRELGFSVQGYEAGSDVGGTWYWNRYPGCRLDTESYTYGYFCLTDIMSDWTWTEQFPGQPEVLRYANCAADRMDVRKNYRFNTKVESAVYNEDANTWDINLDDGSSASCRYLLTAVGPLSATRMPKYAGMASFAGESFHSSDWPRHADGSGTGQQMDFTGKRVAVIGTGATGVQIIPEVAKTAAQLYVFQRTPNWCTPLGNRPISSEKMEFLRQNYDNILAYIKTTDAAFPYHRFKKKGVNTTPEERQAFFEELYNSPGYGIWLGNYVDLLINAESNEFLAEFIADKIRSRVKNQIVAEKLIPKDHPFGSKRVPMETNYYEVYNNENVQLVDIRESPIQRLTAAGIETTTGQYDLDVIIYATGFDGITGSLDRIDIRGKGGKSLKDAWEDGPVTYLGLQVAGFPNLFTLVGAHNGASFCNIAVCGGLQVDWVTKMLRDMRNRNKTYCEPEEDAQRDWTEEVYKIFARTLLRDVETWWVKVKNHPNGTQTRRALVYVGSGPEYRKLCDQVAYYEYKGFEMR
jgi:cation diffusion facilitator CzcD-associated flavoprotein CzcO